MADFVQLEGGGKVKNFKARTLGFCLWPDTNDRHRRILEKLKEGYMYLAVLHDRDLQEDGTPKAPHYHVLVKFSSAKYLSALCSELDLEANLVQAISSFEAQARYFLHLDNPEKYQYAITDLFGTLVEAAVKACCPQESEDERFMRLVELLDSMEYVVTMRQWVQVVCSNGLYADCRRAGYIMRDLLSEHNARWGL